MRAMQHALLVAGLALLAACSSSGPRVVPGKVALVIGNSAYAVATPLTNPANDAKDMCDALTRLGFKTLCPTDLRTREDFEKHVQAYLDALGPGTQGVFFYSGHGVQAAGENYLVPTDAGLGPKSDAPLAQLYHLGELFDKLRQKPSDFQMVILDACRNDPFAAVPAGGRGVSEAVTRRAAFARNLQVSARASYGTAAVNDAPPGTIVLFATASKDTAFDGDGRNGPLTKHLLRNIGERGLSVDDLIKKVTVGVESETRRIFGKVQTPYTYQSYHKKFCFAGCLDSKVFQVPATN